MKPSFQLLAFLESAAKCDRQRSSLDEDCGERRAPVYGGKKGGLGFLIPLALAYLVACLPAHRQQWKASLILVPKSTFEGRTIPKACIKVDVLRVGGCKICQIFRERGSMARKADKGT